MSPSVQWSSTGLITERLRVRLTPGPLQATLSKLITYCAQANSASYPQRDGKWVVSIVGYGWRPSVDDWGDGVSASCTMGPIVF